MINEKREFSVGETRASTVPKNWEFVRVCTICTSPYPYKNWPSYHKIVLNRTFVDALSTVKGFHQSFMNIIIFHNFSFIDDNFAISILLQYLQRLHSDERMHWNIRSFPIFSSPLEIEENSQIKWEPLNFVWMQERSPL